MKTTIKYLSIILILILILSIAWKKESGGERQIISAVSLPEKASPVYTVFILRNSDHDSLHKLVPGSLQTVNCELSHGHISGDHQVIDLIAGGYFDAGDIMVSEDTGYYYITCKTCGGWTIDEINLYLGSKENVPVTIKGNPSPGEFPVRETFSPQAETVVVRIARDKRTESAPYLLAHAVVSRSGQSGEKAWGQDSRHPGPA